MSASLVAIIDDDPFYYSTLKIMLSSFSPTSTLLHFVNGKQVYDYIMKTALDESALPDCIFLDLEMPMMDGMLFLKQFNKTRASLKKEIVVFIISSSLTDDKKQIIYKYPFVRRCIDKPFMTKDIKDAMQYFDS